MESGWGMGGCWALSDNISHPTSRDTTEEGCKLSFNFSVENRFLVSSRA